MARQELDVILAQLDLKVPEAEREDLANAARFIEEKVAIRYAMQGTHQSNLFGMPPHRQNS